MIQFEDYGEVFTPGAPIEMPDLFFGRQQELSDLKNAVKRPGLHPVVIGNRGVGKTSLVHQAFTDLLIPPYFITCNSHMSFNHFAQAVLNKLGLDIAQFDSGEDVRKDVERKRSQSGMGMATPSFVKHTYRRGGLSLHTFDPWHLFESLKNISQKVLIIVDEYDKIPSDATNFHAGIAELIKTLADNRRECDSRLVIVGVAQSAQDLLGRHESIERSAREIYLRPLRYEDVQDFLSEAEKKLDFQFKPTVKQAIIHNSMGYPYYVHLVGLECIDAMLQRDKSARFVTEIDYEKAVKMATKKAFRSELRKYKNAIDGLSEKEITLIRELSKELTTSKSKIVLRLELQRRLSANNVMSVEEFNNTLIRLQQEKKLLYISRNKDDIRFSDPLMAPFLSMMIFPEIKGTSTLKEQKSLFEGD